MTGVEDSGRQAGKSSTPLQRDDLPSLSPGPRLIPARSDPSQVQPPGENSPGGADPVIEQALTEAEAELCAEDFTTPQQQAMAGNLARRQQDQQFLHTLALAGFAGIMWEYFADELAAYGIPVLMSWTRTREIAKLCAEKGRPIRSLPEDWLYEDREGLTVLTVAKAIQVFRDKVLCQGRWDPGRGATIKTYFMGAVILQFPNHYNSWYDERLHMLAHLPVRSMEDTPDLAMLQADQPGSDPAHTAVSRIHLVHVLHDMPGDLRTACLLLYEGYSIKDAAAAVGKTGDALSEQLRRYRNGRGGKMR